MSRINLAQTLPSGISPSRKPQRREVAKPSANFVVDTLATAKAGRSQYRFALIVCVVFAVVTIAMLPIATRTTIRMPGFSVMSQSGLAMLYGLTTTLFLTQYRSTRTVSVLFLAAGSLYTTIAVLAQLACLPEIFAFGDMAGNGSSALSWLRVFWHIGPPLFALPFAIIEGGRHCGAMTHPGRVSRTMWGMIAVICVGSALIVLAATQHVPFLPNITTGNYYWPINTSGLGPALVLFTIFTLAFLCWATLLRSVLQLWLAVSLFLLILDLVVTELGGARGTNGWFIGRGEALFAALVVLGVYLWEFSRLWNQALAQAAVARQNLEIALDAAGMVDFDLHLASDTSRRTWRHDQFFGYSGLEPTWGWARTLEHVVPEDRSIAANAFEAALSSGRLEFECRIRRSCDGVVRWIAMHGRTTFDSFGQPITVAGCLMDVTERKQSEGRLREAERMEAVGQLTGGLAHDFNNLLTVILGNLEMIAKRPDETARVERLATSAFAAGRRGAEITDRLLSFSRRQMLSPVTSDLNKLITELLPLVRTTVGEAVSVETELDMQLEPGFIDHGQLQAAILNLAGNARDAMPNGGHLTIRTRNLMLGHSNASSLPNEKLGDYLHLSVSDTGCGMDAASAARAFEPFFTTKDIGKGNGLGLSQVYGFIRQAGGFCRLASSPGQGCVVDLYLPKSLDLVLSHSRGAFVVPLQQAENGEVVLIVENEDTVRETAAECLAALGYGVLLAPDARTALEILHGPKRVDIVFSDVVMAGGMDGIQLAMEAKKVRPNLRILLTSGYTALVADGVPEKPDGVRYLKKPYLTGDLSRQLRF